MITKPLLLAMLLLIGCGNGSNLEESPSGKDGSGNAANTSHQFGNATLGNARFGQ
jgi:hypothetical protein